MFKELGEFIDNAGRKVRNVINGVLDESSNDETEGIMGELPEELVKKLDRLEYDDIVVPVEGCLPKELEEALNGD